MDAAKRESFFQCLTTRLFFYEEVTGENRANGLGDLSYVILLFAFEREVRFNFKAL